MAIHFIPVPKSFVFHPGEMLWVKVNFPADLWKGTEMVMVEVLQYISEHNRVEVVLATGVERTCHLFSPSDLYIRECWH